MALANSSFRVVPLTMITDCIRQSQPVPPGLVAITFDDGYKTVYQTAFPLLQELGFAATIFLVTGYCNEKNTWPAYTVRTPVLELLSWSEIYAMAEKSFDFGSHSATHADLSRLSERQILEEIEKSKDEIQRRLGKDPSFFAYPYGICTEEIKSIVRKHFRAACSTDLNYVETNSDIYGLPRIDMYYFSKNNWLRWLDTPVLARYIRFRRRLRLLKTRVDNI